MSSTTGKGRYAAGRKQAAGAKSEPMALTTPTPATLQQTAFTAENCVKCQEEFQREQKRRDALNPTLMKFLRPQTLPRLADPKSKERLCINHQSNLDAERFRKSTGTNLQYTAVHAR